MPSSLLRGAASQLARRIASKPTITSASASISTTRTGTRTTTSQVTRPFHQRKSISTSPPTSSRPTTIPIPTSRTMSTAPQPQAQAQAQPTSDDSIITPESLTSKLQDSLQTTHVSIQDMSGGCGQAFTAVIVSPEFEKKTLLARHRLVNGALKQEIAAIHAWTPKCLTPEQWEKEKGRDV